MLMIMSLQSGQFYQNLKGTFLQKMNECKYNKISVFHQKTKNQQVNKNWRKQRQFNIYLHNFHQLTLWYWKLSLTKLTSKVDGNKKKMGKYVKNWQFV